VQGPHAPRGAGAWCACTLTLLLLPPQRGEYAIVQNVTINDFSAKMLATTAEELYGERAEALAFLEGEAVAAAH
jgi:hypothetical protein